MATAADCALEVQAAEPNPRTIDRGKPLKGSTKPVLLEAALVALAGAIIAFAANALSPGGLTLSRNYFPGATRDVVAAPVIASGTRSTATNRSTPADLVAARVKEHGFQMLDREAALERFRDPLMAQGLIVFIDARDEGHYAAGHVPGAFEYDHYRPEKHLATVLPVCQMAEQIVIYCNGGDCEDSLFAAIGLRDAGIEIQKLFIYGGGMQDWAANNLPVELGARNSGNLRPAP